MKRIIFVIIFILYSAAIGICETQNAIITDVRGEIFDDSAQILIEANCDIDYLDYTLENPHRVIIDPIGKVYSDLKEVVTFTSGPVKEVMVVRGKTEGELTGDFYPLDFISIELTSSAEYSVRREVKHEVIIVDIGAKKDVRILKLLPKVEEEAVYEEAFAEKLPVEKAWPAPTPFEEEIIESLPEEELLEPEEVKEIPREIPKEATPLPKPEVKQQLPFAREPVKVVYTIGEGDALDISVWQHSELDKKVIVRPDGYVSFPLVGDVKANGLTPPQLSSLIKENLSRLIKDPQVTVIVSGFGSKNIFVLGEVTKPGSYPYRGGKTVLDAIGNAGGWKSSAVLNSVMVVRKAFTDAPVAHRLNVYALVKKGDFSQNLALEPGDIIYVPKSFIANIGSFIENLKISIGAYVTESTTIFD